MLRRRHLYFLTRGSAEGAPFVTTFCRFTTTPRLFPAHLGEQKTRKIGIVLCLLPILWVAVQPAPEYASPDDSHRRRHLTTHHTERRKAIVCARGGFESHRRTIGAAHSTVNRGDRSAQL